MADPPPPATLSATQALLSEQELFNCQLEMPNLRIGNISFPASKRDSIAFDPDLIQGVPLADFLTNVQNGVNIGNAKVPNTMPPVDWRNSLFSENDNRADLRDKVYLPLSRVLAPRNIAFSQDSAYFHPEGAADTVVVERDSSLVRVVLEEKSELLLRSLAPHNNFRTVCVTGRRQFISGARTKSSQALFQCPLILAQLLGYMHTSRVCRGIIITSGRAIFVWIAPVAVPAAAAGPSARSKRLAARKGGGEGGDQRRIYMSEEMPINHPQFLLAMAGFLIQSFELNSDDGARAADLLGVPTDQGGFSKGGFQQHTPKDRSRRDDDEEEDAEPKKKKARAGKRKGAKNTAASVALAIPQLPQLPDIKHQLTLATTLGRERRGKVIGTEWYGIPVAVKMVYTDGDDGQYARKVFQSEVEAYRMAGSAGLWGRAVPEPLFLADTNSVCALGIAKGVPMPLDPVEWSREDLEQAKESILLLQQSGITLTDIKPANFVKLTDKGTKGNGEETIERVVAIDLECFWKGADGVELPPWLWKQDTPSLVMA